MLGHSVVFSIWTRSTNFVGTTKMNLIYSSNIAIISQNLFYSREKHTGHRDLATGTYSVLIE